MTINVDNVIGWIDHIFVSDKVSVKMVLTPPICSGDLEANQKARAFDPIPNKVTLPLSSSASSLYTFSIPLYCLYLPHDMSKVEICYHYI
jgi:hypothetical protein